jgi:hypothetical protein
MTKVLDTERLKRVAQAAARVLASGDPKIRAGQFNQAPVGKVEPKATGVRR